MTTQPVTEAPQLVKLSTGARVLAVFGLIGVAGSGWALFELIVLAPARPRSAELFQSGGWLAALSFWWLVVLLVQGLVSLAAARLLVLRRRWTLCAAAALGAMVPCSALVFVGLPLGIWLLVMLRRPHVRSAFS